MIQNNSFIMKLINFQSQYHLLNNDMTQPAYTRKKLKIYIQKMFKNILIQDSKGTTLSRQVY